LTGRLTAVAILDYTESLRRSRGDFLRSPRFQDQFQGKSIADPFNVRRDVDNISGATITVAAMARGVRNAARRVAMAYLAGSRIEVRTLHPATVTADDLKGMDWLDVEQSGLAQRITLLSDRERSAIELSLIYLRDP